jgi:hypothetical protein
MNVSFRIAILALAILAGCSSVSIQSTRSPALVETLEPVTFVIFEGNTGAEYTGPLSYNLRRELANHGVRSRVMVLTGAEFDEAEKLRAWASQSKGMILIAPIGGRSYYGTLTQLTYDVQAFQMDGAESVSVWRAKVDSSSGAYSIQVEGRLERVAQTLVGRLVSDRVIPSRKVATN